MSDLATPTFVGVLVVIFFAIRYWRLVLGLVVALLLTTVIMGVRQVINTMEHAASNVPAQSQLDGGPAKRS